MKLTLDPAAFYDLIVQPSFADIEPGANNYPDTLNEWVVMDNVSLVRGQTMIDVFKKQNFLKRKERSCKTVWSTVGTTSNRKLVVDELYGAVEDCQEEFYEGCAKDFRDNPALFRQIAFNIFKGGIRMDALSNCYFGDVARADDPNEVWSWNKFDGIVVKIGEYIDDDTIPDAQVMDALPSGAITPAQAALALQEAYDKRSALMKTILETDLAFYVDQAFAEAYEAYLISTGVNTSVGVELLMNGVPSLKFKRIPIYVERTWNPILSALNGGDEGHMCILTIRGNFVFGTNTKYGGGKDLNQALRIWWSDDDEVWRTKMHMVAGTQLRSPQHVVFGTTDL